MNNTSTNSPGLKRVLSCIVYIIMCLVLFVVFIVPFIVLLIFNFNTRPALFASRPEIENNPPLYRLRLKI